MPGIEAAVLRHRTAVGKNVGAPAASGEHLKHTALELGGNGPFVVPADADADQAVRAAVMGKFLHQRQICMAVNRTVSPPLCCRPA